MTTEQSGARPAGNAGGDTLVRRTISDTLKKTRGWTIVSHTDGTIDFDFPERTGSGGSFVDEVRNAVRDMGYEPTVAIAKGRKGQRVVRVSTPETLAQAPRGTHRK